MSTNQEMKYLLMPAASATGRDFLLERLLDNPEVVAKMIGRESVKVGVMVKTTDRESRTTELTKRCVSCDQFTEGLVSGDIVASYTLESNGKRYGYHQNDFTPSDEFDVIVADASVYQIPDLKKHLGDKMYVAGMIATRQYREDNLRARGSENEDQIQKRLNLGDAHTAMLLIMDGKIDKIDDFVHNDLAKAIKDLFKFVAEGIDSSSAESSIRDFSGSDNVVNILKELATEKTEKFIDELVVLGQEHRITPEMPVTETLFFKTGVDMIKNSLEK
jgi:ribose 1,5-bisphosphokinase PhnN